MYAIYRTYIYLYTVHTHTHIYIYGFVLRNSKIKDTFQISLGDDGHHFPVQESVTEMMAFYDDGTANYFPYRLDSFEEQVRAWGLCRKYLKGWRASFLVKAFFCSCYIVGVWMSFSDFQIISKFPGMGWIL